MPRDDDRRSARRRLGALVLALGIAFALAFALLPHDPAVVKDVAAAPRPLLAAAALAAWVLLTPALVSSTLLCAATGLLLGAGAGMPVALIGATLGGTVAFLVARRAGGGAAQALAGPRVARLQERVERRPVLAIALVRVAPGCPATLLHYAAGLTRIRVRHFAAGIALGGAPRILAYTALAGAAAERAVVPALILSVAMAVLAVAGAAVARRRRAAPVPAGGA